MLNFVKHCAYWHDQVVLFLLWWESCLPSSGGKGISAFVSLFSQASPKSCEAFSWGSLRAEPADGGLSHPPPFWGGIGWPPANKQHLCPQPSGNLSCQGPLWRFLGNNWSQEMVPQSRQAGLWHLARSRGGRERGWDEMGLGKGTTY